MRQPLKSGGSHHDKKEEKSNKAEQKDGKREESRDKKEEQEAETDPYPHYQKANFNPAAHWRKGPKTYADIQTQASEAFEKMRFWRKNLWKVPSGKVGKLLLLEMTDLLENWTRSTEMELIALTLNMIFLPLMLQKSGRNVNAKAVKEIVEKRLDQWNRGNIAELVEEAEYLQAHLQNSSHQNEQTAKIFARLMLQGKVKAALRVVSGSQGGVATASAEVLKKLQEKHPEAAPTDPSVILPGEFKKVPDSTWEKIDGEMIRSLALNMKGAGGWSGLDSDDLRPLLCSKNFGRTADGLCQATADLTKRLCRSLVDPASLETFLACRLIPLEKGGNDVRPIGIGETLRRLVGKAAVRAVRSDIQRACGSLQVCAGLESGCEAAVHAVRESFEEDETEAALLIDASNAFNSVKRECTLKNIAVLCPAFYIFLVNTYRRPIRLLIPAWKMEIPSVEGTTQGDPAAMGMYALSVLPIIKMSLDISHAGFFLQAWYADDGTGLGKLLQLREWWSRVSTTGPRYGYYANAKKTVLVVKAAHAGKAKQLFEGTDVQIVETGARHLGAAIGDQSFIRHYVEQKVQKWCSELKTLAEFSRTEPQAAYSAFVFGFRGKWNFLQRTVPNCAHLFQPLEELMKTTFLPQLTGRTLTNLERDLMSLPAREGGLGLTNPVETSTTSFQDSHQITHELSMKIKAQDVECPSERKIKEAKKQVIQAKRKREKEKLANLKQKIKDEHPQNSENPHTLKILESVTAKGASSWLTSLPLQDENRALNKEEFRDALALRYGWRPKNLPQKCACGSTNSITHCLDCKLGGFVTMRHNEIRNVFAKLLSRAGCKSVQIEQQLLPVEGELDGLKGVEKGDESRMDVTAVGFWGSRRMRKGVRCLLETTFRENRQKERRRPVLHHGLDSHKTFICSCSNKCCLLERLEKERQEKTHSRQQRDGVCNLHHRDKGSALINTH